MVRKKYSKELKARIALDAIKGQKTIAELASEYGVHANQISIWKKQLLDAAPARQYLARLIFVSCFLFAKMKTKSSSKPVSLQDEIIKQRGS